MEIDEKKVRPATAAWSKPRVAMFVEAFPVLSETFIVNQITGLLDRDCEVDVFSLSRRSLDSPHAVIDQYGLLDRVIYLNAKPANLLSALIECISKIVSNPRWLSPKGTSLLLRIARRKPGLWGRLAAFRVAHADMVGGRYDIIHCQYGGLGERVLPLVKAGIVSGRLYTAIRGHDVTQKERYTADFYSELFELGNCFMPVSDSLRQRLIELGCDDDKIRIVRSGIDCAKFIFKPRYFIEGEPTKLISVGRLIEMKGFEYAIIATHQLLSQGFDVEYEIVGDGVQREELTRLIADLGLQGRVSLVGALAHEELLERLAASHIFVMPSVTASNGEMEGIPNALKEAMAQGMPVIATRHSGIPELVKDGVSGFLVAEKDSKGMAAKLIELMQEPSKWLEMGKAGRAVVEQQYDRAVVLDSLLACYAAVLGDEG